MNMFNCFQAVALYTVIPLGIQYLATHDQMVWAVILGVIEAIGYVLLSIAVSDAAK